MARNGNKSDNWVLYVEKGGTSAFIRGKKCAYPSRKSAMFFFCYPCKHVSTGRTWFVSFSNGWTLCDLNSIGYPHFTFSEILFSFPYHFQNDPKPTVWIELPLILTSVFSHVSGSQKIKLVLVATQGPNWDFLTCGLKLLYSTKSKREFSENLLSVLLSPKTNLATVLNKHNERQAV